MDINDDLKALIQKQLPGMYAEQMKTFITEAEENKKKLTQADKSINDLEAKLKEETELRKSAQNKQAAAEAVIAREEALKYGEQKLALEFLRFEVKKEIQDLKVVEAEKRATAVYNLTGILFQNETISQRIMESRNKWIDGHSHGSEFIQSHNTSENYSYTKDETKDKPLPPNLGEQK